MHVWVHIHVYSACCCGLTTTIYARHNCFVLVVPSSKCSLAPALYVQDAVAVVGYPIGGDTISVTSGVVSRIEVTSYVHGSTELLGVQIDAAINSGNSGGALIWGLCVDQCRACNSLYKNRGCVSVAWVYEFAWQACFIVLSLSKLGMPIMLWVVTMHVAPAACDI